MKNRRNTRRGRAKRWHSSPGVARFRTYHFLRRSNVTVETAWPRDDAWWIEAGDGETLFGPFYSRAAAMRAAEHLARRR